MQTNNSAIGGTKKPNLTHWTCPYCKVIIPDYRRSFESLETRVKNHLEKFHFDVESKTRRDLIHDLHGDYFHH